MEAIYKVKIDASQAEAEAKRFDKTLEQVVDEIRDLDKATDQFSTDKLEASLDDINKLVESGTLNFEDYSKVIEQYTDIALKAGNASPIADEAIANAAALKQEFQTVEAQIDVLSQKGGNLNAALQLAEGVTAGYQAFIGITALVGDENEELVEVLTKLQAVQGVAQSLQTLRNALDKESILLVKGKQIAQQLFGGILKRNVVAQTASAAASSAQATATSAGAVAQTALNVAMNANPIFLIITAIVALVSTLVIFISTTNKAKDAQEAYNREVEDTARSVDRANAAIQRSASVQNEELKRKNDLLNSEIEYLQSLDKRTKKQEEILKKKLFERQANEIKQFDNSINASLESATNGYNKFITEFESLDNSFRALQTEDGIANINYDQAQAEINSLITAYDKLQRGFKSGNEAEYAESVENIQRKLESTTFAFRTYRLAFEGQEDELEAIDLTIEKLGSIGDVIDENIGFMDKYNGTIKDKDTFTALEERRKKQQELEDQQRRSAEASRRREQRRQEALREEQRLQQLLIDYTRRTEDIRVSLIEESYEREFESLTLNFERQINAIEGNSEQANALRLALFDQFVAKENEINQRRANQLAEQEKALVQQIDQIRNSLVLDDGAQRLEDLRLQQESELEVLRQGLEQELITQQEFDLLLLEQKAQYEALLTQIEQEESDKRKQIAESEKQEKIQKFQEYTEGASNLISGLTALNELSTQIQLSNAEGNEAKQESIRKKSFERSKKLQIAQATIAGIQGVINALTASSTIPEPFGTILKAVNAASVGISTAANIAKIRNTKFQGGGGGSASIPSPAGAGGLGGLGATAGQASGGSDLSDIQTILDGTNTAQDAGNNPTQVVVVESDITATQTAVAEAQEKSSF